MSYSLTLSFNNEAEAIEFPLLPEKIEVNESGNSKSYEISKLGEVNVIKTKKLAEISFNSMFPANWFPACNVDQGALFKPSHYIVDKITKWRESKQPMRLVFTGGPMNINLPVSIEKFTWAEEGGAVGDIKYSISFKEYKFYSAKKVEVVKPTATTATPTVKKKTAAKRPNTKVKPKTYTLVKGDNLWKVAKKFLGDGSKYKQIQKLNGIKDSELKRLQIGRVIKLP
ncbi:LysM repeat protein [Paenibacillus turicensis]|uniref:LysM repeat protein n=1 Tax=Paenibacillus turicensis TaxID=160487 RepID=A0ABS4FW39_9BACL|nr:LysM peptidoglycan-binding domain-containing protein [Paenibacillus turicensis]MBP1906801.1 LysM repeat protein [Paenibacillus turicensis]